MKQRNHLKTLISKFTLPDNDWEIVKPENRNLQVTKECCICLDIPKSTKSKPWNWNHLFCFTCLKSWCNVTNACPLCKVEFKFIVIINDEGVEINREEVEEKKPGTEMEYLNQIADEWYVWNRSDNEPFLLIWDYWDFKVCHTYWDDLDAIPETEWFWTECRAIPQDQRAERLIDYDSDNIDEVYSFTEREDEKDLQSENDEEYDPYNDTINSTFVAREERENSSVASEIFDENIKYDVCESNSFIVDEYRPPKTLKRLNAKESNQWIFTNDDQEINQFYGRSLRKRSVKARMKCIEESESEVEDWVTEKQESEEEDKESKEENKESDQFSRRITRATSKILEDETTEPSLIRKRSMNNISSRKSKRLKTLNPEPLEEIKENDEESTENNDYAFEETKIEENETNPKATKVLRFGPELEYNQDEGSHSQEAYSYSNCLKEDNEWLSQPRRCSQDAIKNTITSRASKGNMTSNDNRTINSISISIENKSTDKGMQYSDQRNYIQEIAEITSSLGEMKQLGSIKQEHFHKNLNDTQSDSEYQEEQSQEFQEVVRKIIPEQESDYIILDPDEEQQKPRRSVRLKKKQNYCENLFKVVSSLGKEFTPRSRLTRNAAKNVNYGGEIY